MSLFRPDIARTLGDLLLGHLYEQCSGDGRSSVRLDPEHAATLLSSDGRPAAGEVRVLRDMLHALVDNRTPAFRVTKCPDRPGAFLIQPRHPAQPVSPLR